MNELNVKIVGHFGPVQKIWGAVIASLGIVLICILGIDLSYSFSKIALIFLGVFFIGFGLFLLFYRFEVYKDKIRYGFAARKEIELENCHFIEKGTESFIFGGFGNFNELNITLKNTKKFSIYTSDELNGIFLAMQNKSIIEPISSDNCKYKFLSQKATN